jgi:hypothetical protein
MPPHVHFEDAGITGLIPSYQALELGKLNPALKNDILLNSN